MNYRVEAGLSRPAEDSEITGIGAGSARGGDDLAAEIYRLDEPQKLTP
jgi:hypothetical protein